MRSPTYTGFVIMCAGAAVMASLSPVRAVFTVALVVVLALKLAEEEEALKAARPEEWAKYSEILGFWKNIPHRLLETESSRYLQTIPTSIKEGYRHCCRMYCKDQENEVPTEV